MKLKGAAKKMKAGFPVTVALLLLAAFVALRVYQSLTLIDPSTGFFTNKSNITVPAFFALIVGMPLVTLLLFYVCPLSKAEGLPVKPDLPHTLGALTLCAAVVSDSLFLAEQRTRITLACAALGALAAVSLLVLGVSFLAGRDLVKRTKLLHLFPALWALTKTVSVFTVNAPYLRNSALLTGLFADMFLMIFFYEYGIKVTALGGDKNSPAFLTAGFTAAALQLGAFATGVIGLLPGHTEFLHAPFAAYRPAAALFCLTAILAFFRHKAPDYVPHGPESEEIETYPLPPETPDAAEDAAEEAPEDEA